MFADPVRKSCAAVKVIRKTTVFFREQLIEELGRQIVCSQKLAGGAGSDQGTQGRSRRIHRRILRQKRIMITTAFSEQGKGLYGAFQLLEGFAVFQGEDVVR